MRSARRIVLITLLCLAGSAASSSYTLRSGDTLSGVASKFRIPLQALTAANADKVPNPDRVRAGTTIVVPDRAAAQVAMAKPIASGVAPGSQDAKRYVVAAGDTLGGIAKRFGTTTADLVQRNGLAGTNAILREGRSLDLPPEAVVPTPEAPVCPVRGASKWDFSNSFGAPRDGQRSHAGNDVFSRRGTPVVAVVDGRLRTVRGGRAGFGYYLDGVDGVTYYGAHMDGLAVGDGATVRRGDTIGSVGNSGNAAGTPPHLHFEIKPGGGSSIDPYGLLRNWCR